MFWYIVLLIMMAFPLSLAYVGYVRKINMRVLVLPLSLMILFFFMSCRAENVGADTAQYVYGFRQICNTSLNNLARMEVYGLGGNYRLNFEFGYRMYNKAVSVFSTNGQAITVANSLMILLLLRKLIRTKSDYPFMSIWLYITLGIFQTQMNMSRNAIGILICYLGLKYIEERSFAKYILCILLAMLFHTSSILFIPFYWLAGRVKLTPKMLRRILIAAIALGFSFSVFKPFLVTSLPFGFGRYFGNNTQKFSSLLVGVFHVVLLLLTWLLTERTHRREAVEDEYVGMWMFVGNIFFFCVGYDVAAASRMAALFGPYLIVLIPNLLQKGIRSDRKRLAAIASILVLTGAQYVFRISVNNIGATQPYQFFWS